MTCRYQSCAGSGMQVATSTSCPNTISSKAHSPTSCPVYICMVCRCYPNAPCEFQQPGACGSSLFTPAVTKPWGEIAAAALSSSSRASLQARGTTASAASDGGSVSSSSTSTSNGGVGGQGAAKSLPNGGGGESVEGDAKSSKGGAGQQQQRQQQETNFTPPPLPQSSSLGGLSLLVAVVCMVGLVVVFAMFCRKRTLRGAANRTPI